MSEVLSNAELAKEQGNEAFAKKDFAAAVKHYTRAIVFEPAAGYFCNRSAARLSLGHAEWAVEDAITATRLDPNTLKRWRRLGSALKACERRQEAKLAFERGKATDELKALAALPPVAVLTSEELRRGLDELVPKQHGWHAAQELARRAEAAGMISQTSPTDSEALLFDVLVLHAERKYYTPKPVDEFFPLLACRALHVLNRSPSLEFETVTANGVTAPMRKQVQNLLRNMVASSVRYCNAEKLPAPPSSLDEMIVIVNDKNRGPFSRFMALWLLWTSSKYEKNNEKRLAYAEEIVEIGATAKSDASCSDLMSQIKPIFDEVSAFVKQQK